MSQEASLELTAINVIKKRPSFRTLNDVRRFRHSSTGNIGKFEALKDSQIIRVLSLRTLEYKIKMLAVSLVVTKLLNKMAFLTHNIERQLKEFSSISCTKEIFSWSYDDWLITLPHRSAWFNMLEHQMPPPLLQTWLTSKNFRAFRNGFKLIFDAYMSQSEKALEALAPIIKLHNMEDDVSEELKKGTKITDDARIKLMALNVVKTGWASLQKNSEDKYCIANIENKYLLDYSKVKEEEVAYRNQLTEKRLIAEIQSYRKRTYIESFASSATRDAYFNEIVTLRDRIDKMTKRYDFEYNRLEGDISHLKSSLEKLHMNRTCLLENIEWFKKERESNGDINRERKVRRSRKRSIKSFTREIPKQQIKRQTSIISNRSNKIKSLLPRTKAKRNTSLKSA